MSEQCDDGPSQEEPAANKERVDQGQVEEDEREITPAWMRYMPKGTLTNKKKTNQSDDFICIKQASINTVHTEKDDATKTKDHRKRDREQTSSIQPHKKKKVTYRIIEEIHNLDPSDPPLPLFTDLEPSITVNSTHSNRRLRSKYSTSNHSSIEASALLEMFSLNK